MLMTYPLTLPPHTHTFPYLFTDTHFQHTHILNMQALLLLVVLVVLVVSTLASEAKVARVRYGAPG